MCADIDRRLRFAKFLWSKLLLLFLVVYGCCLSDKTD